jgi:hypothetical protein
VLGGVVVEWSGSGGGGYYFIIFVVVARGIRCILVVGVYVCIWESRLVGWGGVRLC